MYLNNQSALISNLYSSSTELYPRSLFRLKTLSSEINTLLFASVLYPNLHII